MQAFGRLGYDVKVLLASAGVREADLNDRDSRVPCEALAAMIAFARQERFTPNLGLELARVTPIGAYPLLDYLVATSDTVGEGVRQLSHYYGLVGNPVTFGIEESADEIRIEMPAAAPHFGVEFCASLMILHFRGETNGRFRATDVNFLQKVDDARAMESVLDCAVHCAAGWNGIRASRGAWNESLRRRDTALRELLEAQANQIGAPVTRRSGLAEEVRQVLAARLGCGDMGIDAVARKFAMSPRTLQRRLAGEGASYQELRETARKEIAGRFLRESLLSIAEVAYLAGYSEPAQFHRAFKRWYGKTPEVFRRAAF
jgi:AraC-like DNA-binding protein